MTRSNGPTLSVVIPLYNEQEIVPELIGRTASACRGIGESFEIVVVNDGSRDHTLEALVRQSQEVPELRVVDLLRNFGHMPALSAGIAVARGQAVVVMDGDLQDPPELIPQFVREWRNGADVVYGLRTARREAWLKRTLIGGFYWLLDHTTETKIPKQVGTFGLMDRKIVDILNQMPERSRYFAGLRAWAGGKQTFVPYERPDREGGGSRVGAQGLFRLARTALISFSKVPLRYASALALVSGLTLFMVGAWAVFEKLFTDNAIPGWATYTTLIGFMGFVQSLVLSALSEYVAVIFDEVKQRPLFVIRTEYHQGLQVQALDPSARNETRRDFTPASSDEVAVGAS
mgnify:CR=1 FL=1|jgi:Glycosyltransferases involved in cell wall biogenesis